MNVFEYTHYKRILRAAIKEKQTEKKSFTLKKLASLIQIRNTYLSRLLNDETAHFSEDHLYLCCKNLGFQNEQIDYILLLRTHAATNDSVRKQYLANLIDRQRKENQLMAEVQKHSTETLPLQMEYMLDPLVSLTYAALGIPEYQKDPAQLCSPFGISFTKLREILKTLTRLELIELEPESLKIKKVLKTQIHFGRDHPLMRTHQALLKTLVHSQVLKTAEENKVSFQATFSSDHEGFERAKMEFQKFVKSVELIAVKSKSKSVYQLSLDLFKWV